MADLQPHEQRVVAELDELRERTHKLETFVGSRAFVNLAGEDRELLVLQLHLMESLGFVLARRITRFTAGVSASDGETFCGQHPELPRPGEQG
jgi:hypothetical protein